MATLILFLTVLAWAIVGITTVVSCAAGVSAAASVRGWVGFFFVAPLMWINPWSILAVVWLIVKAMAGL